MMSITNITKLIMAPTLTCMVCACDFAEKNIDPNSPYFDRAWSFVDLHSIAHYYRWYIQKHSSWNLHDACTTSRFFEQRYAWR